MGVSIINTFQSIARSFTNVQIFSALFVVFHFHPIYFSVNKSSYTGKEKFQEILKQILNYLFIAYQQP